MKRKQRWFLVVISFLVSILLVYGLYNLQVRHIQEKQSIAIYVANDWLQAGHIITQADIKQMQYPSNMVTKEMILQSEQLINRELVIPLGKEEPFTNWKINEFHLLPKQGEATFQIPSYYIKSLANDLRAGDYVFIYASGDHAPSNKLFDMPIKVASVKTSTNAEVESVYGNELDALLRSNQHELYQHRRKTNGVIEYINLNLTEEQWLTVDALCKDGQAQLIVAYTPYYVSEQAFN